MLVYEQAFHKPPAVDYPRKRSSEKEKVSAVAGSAGVNRPYSFISILGTTYTRIYMRTGQHLKLRCNIFAICELYYETMPYIETEARPE